MSWLRFLAWLRKYWDIWGGGVIGVALAFMAEFKIESIQLYYSVIILILVSVGALKVVKQTIEKRKRRHIFIDDIKTLPDKAVSFASDPAKEGERVGRGIVEIINLLEVIMEKIKVFFDKFKGYLLTFALAVLTAVEMCGGFINELFGGTLILWGIEVIPFVTLAATVVVGILSNGYTTEQRAKIKALFSKTSANELVFQEIKKSIKETKAKLTEFNKVLAQKNAELEALQGELRTAQNTYEAKTEMANMTPKLATAEDVQLAKNTVIAIEAKIADKKAEIADTQKTLKKLNTTLSALQSQLKVQV